MDSYMDTCTTFAPAPSNIANLKTLQLTVRQEEMIKMPEHSGSMLRGAFGVALRSLTCITDLPECKQCPLKQHCKFPRIFESPALQSSSVQAVNPYVIHPPVRRYIQSINHKTSISAKSSNTYKNGDIWHFGMTLMGAAIDESDLIIKAWQLALQTGLGAHAPYQRATLLKVTADDDTLYSAPNYLAQANIKGAIHKNDPQTLTGLSNNQATPSAMLQQLIASDDPVHLTLRFLTPFRYQQNNRIVSQPNHLDSTTFLASLYNRIRLCQDNHSPSQIWDIGYDSYHDFKNDIAILDVDTDIAANHVARRSNRQQRRMELYGLQGDIHLSGNSQTISRLLPALLLGEQLHIGKNTTMGLGQYRLILTAKE